jgi:hypothetical protein
MILCSWYTNKENEVIEKWELSRTVIDKSIAFDKVDGLYPFSEIFARLKTLEEKIQQLEKINGFLQTNNPL